MLLPVARSYEVSITRLLSLLTRQRKLMLYFVAQTRVLAAKTST
jgi:hypothetical protein